MDRMHDMQQAEEPPMTREAIQHRGPISIYDDICPWICADLARELLAESEQVPAFPTKNIGGWKSSEGILDRCRPPYDQLRAAIVQILEDLSPMVASARNGRIVGWAMVNRAGAEHVRHQHYRTIITGVYYVTAGGDSDAERNIEPTPTVFETPGAIWGDELSVDPAPGRLILFPGSMWHRVPKISGNLPRITVAFDVRY